MNKTAMWDFISDNGSTWNKFSTALHTRLQTLHTACTFICGIHKTQLERYYTSEYRVSLNHLFTKQKIGYIMYTWICIMHHIQSLMIYTLNTCNIT
jgi:hypothetical protein